MGRVLEPDTTRWGAACDPNATSESVDTPNFPQRNAEYNPGDLSPPIEE